MPKDDDLSPTGRVLIGKPVDRVSQKALRNIRRRLNVRSKGHRNREKRESKPGESG